MWDGWIVAKLVVAIESRTPDSGGVGGGYMNSWGLGGNNGVKRLKYLEMHNCDLGMDVERWRIESVVCVDPSLSER